jgi:hypothetical protein
MVIVELTGTEPIFAAAKLLILPDPEAARPIDGSELTHV